MKRRKPGAASSSACCESRSSAARVRHGSHGALQSERLEHDQKTWPTRREEMGWLMGLEPTTPGITIQYSTVELQPPSENAMLCNRSWAFARRVPGCSCSSFKSKHFVLTRLGEYGAPGGNRTHNPRLRRPVLCPLSYGRPPARPPCPVMSRNISGTRSAPGGAPGPSALYSRNPLIVNEKSRFFRAHL